MDNSFAKKINDAGYILPESGCGYSLDFHDGLVRVNQGGRHVGCIESYDGEYLCTKIEGGKWGFVDTNGLEKIPCIYDDATDFSCGYALVEMLNKKIFIDTNGNKLSCAYFDDACPFSQDMAVIIRNNICGIIDNKGIEIVPCIYENIKLRNDGIIVQSNNKWGLIDASNNIIVDFIFDEIIYSRNNDILAVRFGSLWGLINTQGRIIIPTSYEILKKLDNQILLVKKDNCYGIVYGFEWHGCTTNTFTEIVPCVYESIYYKGVDILNIINNYNTEIAGITVFTSSVTNIVLAVKKLDRGIQCDVFGIDKKMGDIKLSFKCDKTNGVIVEHNDKKGLWDINFNIIAPCIYDEISNDKGFPKVIRLGSKCGLINDKGHIVLPVDYDAIIKGKYYNYSPCIITKNGEKNIFDPYHMTFSRICEDRRSIPNKNNDNLPF